MHFWIQDASYSHVLFLISIGQDIAYLPTFQRLRDGPGWLLILGKASISCDSKAELLISQLQHLIMPSLQPYSSSLSQCFKGED